MKTWAIKSFLRLFAPRHEAVTGKTRGEVSTPIPSEQKPPKPTKNGLKNENPEVARFVRQWAGDDKRPDLADRAIAYPDEWGEWS